MSAEDMIGKEYSNLQQLNEDLERATKPEAVSNRYMWVNCSKCGKTKMGGTVTFTELPPRRDNPGIAVCDDCANKKPMKFILKWASDAEPPREIEINTLEELMDLIKEHANFYGVIITTDGEKTIMIYDDLVE